jgi:hypothetical protein
MIMAFKAARVTRSAALRTTLVRPVNAALDKVLIAPRVAYAATHSSAILSLTGAAMIPMVTPAA